MPYNRGGRIQLIRGNFKTKRIWSNLWAKYQGITDNVNICLHNQQGDIAINGRSVLLNDSSDINITKRELKIIRLVFKRHSNQEISEKLF